MRTEKPGGSRGSMFSTMPIKELIRAFDTPVPENIRQISDGLIPGTSLLLECF